MPQFYRSFEYRGHELSFTRCQFSIDVGNTSRRPINRDTLFYLLGVKTLVFCALKIVNLQSGPRYPVGSWSYVVRSFLRSWPRALTYFAILAWIVELAMHTHAMVPLAAEGEIQGDHLHCEKTAIFLPLFTKSLLPFHNRGFEVSSPSNSSSTVTLAVGFSPKSTIWATPSTCFQYRSNCVIFSFSWNSFRCNRLWISVLSCCNVQWKCSAGSGLNRIKHAYKQRKKCLSC